MKFKEIKKEMRLLSKSNVLLGGVICSLFIMGIVGCSEEDNPYRVFDGKLYNTYEEVVFGPSYSLNPIFRIPSVVITNDGTLLVACDNRLASEDKGNIGVLVSRKDETTGVWNLVKVIPYSMDTYGRATNPIFVIDRTGAHGKKGRIFLFLAYNTSTEYFNNSSVQECDFVYMYSDDDGKTWSPEYSLKKFWDNSQYTAVAPSACNGIQLENGTFLIPTMVLKDQQYRSGILLKRPKGDWIFSTFSDIDGDNECCVYIDNDGQIILDCRTLDKIHRKYKYDLKTNRLELLPYFVNVPLDLKAEITKIEDGNEHFFLTTYVDTSRGVRENLTLYGSNDAINWIKLYTLKEGENVAYGSVASYNGKTVVVYEDLGRGKILLQTISSMTEDIIRKLRGQD